MPNGECQTAQGASWFCSDAFTLVSHRVTGAAPSQLAAAEMLFGNIFPSTFFTATRTCLHIAGSVGNYSERAGERLGPSPPHLHAEAKLKRKRLKLKAQ